MSHGLLALFAAVQILVMLSNANIANSIRMNCVFARWMDVSIVKTVIGTTILTRITYMIKHIGHDITFQEVPNEVT